MLSNPRDRCVQNPGKGIKRGPAANINQNGGVKAEK
jgi:hypothetical protein